MKRRYFIVRGALLEKAKVIQAAADIASTQHKAWADKRCGNGAEPVYQGGRCAGVVGGKIPSGWRKIGNYGSQDVFVPKAKGATAEAYKEFKSLTVPIQLTDALKGSTLQRGPVLGEDPGVGLGIAFYRTTTQLYVDKVTGEQVLLVVVPCDDASSFPCPDDCTELLLWEWEKWMHEQGEAEKS